MADRATGSRVTLADVARAAGVSVPLVSIVMRNAPGASPASRERVLAVAAELGYRPDQRARLLRLQRSRLLGVCFGVEHAFHGDLLDAIYQAADARGYDVVLSGVTPNRREERAIETLLADRCEALLLLGSQLSPSRLTRLNSSMPVVVVARRLRNADVDAVHTADAMGAAMAVDHLAGLGHRRIAHVDGGRAPGATDRRNGYRSAMRRHGLADEILIVSGGLGEDDGTRATRALLADRHAERRSSRSTTVVRSGCWTPSGALVRSVPHGRLGGRFRRQPVGQAGDRRPDHRRPGRSRPRSIGGRAGDRPARSRLQRTLRRRGRAAPRRPVHHRGSPERNPMSIGIGVIGAGNHGHRPRPHHRPLRVRSPRRGDRRRRRRRVRRKRPTPSGRRPPTTLAR